MKKKSLLKVSSGVFFILGLVALIFVANTIPANAAKTINIGYPCSVTGPAAMEFMIAADIVKGRVAEINASAREAMSGYGPLLENYPFLPFHPILLSWLSLLLPQA